MMLSKNLISARFKLKHVATVFSRPYFSNGRAVVMGYVFYKVWAALCWSGLL